MPIALLLLFALVVASTQTLGNGWEHGAIPFEALVKALDFEGPERRRRAAQSLGFRGQPEAVPPILRRLAKPEENRHVRSALYLALGRLRDQRAIPVLTTCLDKEVRDELRSDCVVALGMIAQESTLPLLMTALREDTSFIVKSRVVDALGNFSQPAAVTTLAALVIGDSNRSLRDRAIRALGRTGSEKAVEPLLKVLKEARTDNNRILVVKALTQLQPRAATVPLTQLLAQSGNPELRTQIVIALGAIRDGDTYPTLIAMLADEVPAVRYFAIKALTELGRSEAAAPIGKLSLQIAQRLQEKSTKELLADPVTTLADLSFQVVALQALTDLDAARALPALLSAARPRDIPRDSATALKIAEGFYRQRRAALYGLGYTGSREAVAILVGRAGLGDPDFRLRAVGVRALGVLGFADTTERLLDSLADPAAEVRWTTASVLGRLGDRAAVGPLSQRLADAHAEVRKQAALSLGYLGDPSALDTLRRLSQHDDIAAVREAAVHSIHLLSE